MLQILHRVLKTKYVHRTLSVHRPFLPMHSFQSLSFAPKYAVHLSSFCTSAEEKPLVEKVTARKFIRHFVRESRDLLVRKNLGGFRALMFSNIRAAQDEYKSDELVQHVQVNAMQVCLQNRNNDMALTIGNEMVASGITMNQKAHKALLMTLCVNGKYQEVVELYEEIEKDGRVQCDAGMSAEYLQSLNFLGEFEKTLIMFEKTKPQDQHAYRAALQASSKLADVVAVKSLVKAIKENGWRLGYSDLGHLIDAALHAKQYDQAMDWHTQVRKLKLMSPKHGEVYSELIGHFAEEQEWGKVIAMCEECIKDGIVPLYLKSTPHHLKALLEMGYWKNAVVVLARANGIGFSDITGELTKRIYNKVLEDGDAAGLASVLKSYVWTLQEFSNEEVLAQLALLYALEGDHYETIHWLIRNGTRSSSDQMVDLIVKNQTTPFSMKKSVKDKVAYSDVSRFQTAVDMHQVDTVLQFLEEHQELDDLFRMEDGKKSMDFFLDVIQILLSKSVHDEGVRERALIRVLETHLVLNSKDTVPDLWVQLVNIMMDRVLRSVVPSSLLVALVHFAKVNEIALQYKSITYLLSRGIKTKSTDLLLPAYQIAIQENWQPPSFRMAKELFELHVSVGEWEAAITIFQNYLLVIHKATGKGRSLPYELRLQIVQACHQIGYTDLKVGDIDEKNWKTIQFVNHHKE